MGRETVRCVGNRAISVCTVGCGTIESRTGAVGKCAFRLIGTSAMELLTRTSGVLLPCGRLSPSGSVP